MKLNELIRAKRLKGTAAEIAARLNEKTEESIDDTPKSWVDIAAAQGNDTVRNIRQALQSAGLDWLAERISQGTSLADEKVRAILSDAASKKTLDDHTADTLLSLGRKRLSTYELYFGEGAVVTEDEVRQALQTPIEHGRTITLQIISRFGKKIVTLNMLNTDENGVTVPVNTWSWVDGAGSPNVEQHIVEDALKLLSAIEGK